MPPVEQIARDAASRYPLPPVLYRLLGLNVPGVEDAPEAGTVLAEVVSRDHDLTRRLRWMSSAEGPWRSRVERRPLAQGVRDLGFRRVHSSALSISLIGGLPVKTSVVDFLRFWRYSMAVSFLTQSAAYRRRFEGLESGAAAGLFHDVGRLLIEDVDAVGMQRIRARQLAGEGPWLELEREELGFTAFDLTIALLRAWDLPPQLVDAVAGLGAEHPPPLSVALRDSVLTARALDFATKTGRRYELVPDVVQLVDRYFEGVTGLDRRIEGILAASTVSLGRFDDAEGGS